MPTLKVAVIVGSLRRGSYTRKIAKALIALAPDVLECKIVEIGDLTLYNQDLDSKPPRAWEQFRGQIKSADAVLFLTPEYNRSIPGCLKNAIDIGSRPDGRNVFDGLPAGVVSVTPYKLGAFGANHALRQSCVFLNMPLMQQPEAYIANAARLLDEKGAPKSKETRDIFTTFMTSFAKWVEAIVGGRATLDFDDFMKRREQAAKAYVRGDAGPLNAMLVKEDQATFYPPNGGSVRGAKAVAARYDKDARSFLPQGTTDFDLLQAGAAGDIAFWTGFQNAKVVMRGHREPVSMRLRITELFRFEDGAWKLIHRHADAMTSQR